MISRVTLRGYLLLLILLTLLLSQNAIADNDQNFQIRRGLFNEDISTDHTTSSTEYPERPLVGGQQAGQSEFPAFTLFANGECSGTLISPDRVLTSASCVYGGAPDTVRVGATTRNNGHSVSVRCAKSHPNYVFNRYPYDIAVLKLTEKVTNVKTPFLNTNTSYPAKAGTELTVAGMGRNSTTGEMASNLEKLTYAYVPDDICRNDYGDLISQGLYICAYEIGKGACFGDTGGGLYDGDGVLVGVLSGAEGGCAAANVEDVYADAAAFFDWIESQENDETCDDDCVGCLCTTYAWASNLFSSVKSFFFLS